MVDSYKEKQIYYDIEPEKYINDINNTFIQLNKEIVDELEVISDIKSQQTVVEVFNTRLKG